ncbi:putative branched-chain-amino-acid aminotransferase-1 [Coleophoma crateriformis]|uniref:Branched-chain-amino-acid aminotransferase n=1 Tax=Coleophoma crateriformis TaxID=565419 RepID=A0A3D8SXW8_9HELO|nr:putative branched-chain-amino-acid aminotransferase-1 [Coleophoma crateriformis]
MAPSAVTPAGIEPASALTAAAVSQKLNGSAPTLRPLDASKLTFSRTTAPMAVPELDDPIIKTSSQGTDHMITCKWTDTSGWEAPELRPYGNLSLAPTASVLHYSTECFEGMKLYRGYDGKLRLFRPDANCMRMLISATRISLPAFDPEQLEILIKQLVAIDGEKWLPKSRPGHFLYLRPAMIGSGAGLGVGAPKEATLFVIAIFMPVIGSSPQGMKLLASRENEVRAWLNGTGYAKIGGNYGPTLMANSEAQSRGYDQILWLYGEDARVTEAGASNFFVVWRTREGKLQMTTAPLGDKIILDGVTRRSILQLSRERLADGTSGLEAIEVVERNFTMGDVAEAISEGRMVEAFAAGTAYFVCPVSEINFKNQALSIPMAGGESGEYAAMIKQWLVNIMYGKEDHEFGIVVEEKNEL